MPPSDATRASRASRVNTALLYLLGAIGEVISDVAVALPLCTLLAFPHSQPSRKVGDTIADILGKQLSSTENMGREFTSSVI
ncbi:MAG: hypothetical protein ACK41O_26420, partial [Runella zeae]